jgi:hypothetical protein
MKSHSLFSRRTQSVFFILILALASQACAISLIEWPDLFPTAGPARVLLLHLCRGLR